MEIQTLDPLYLEWSEQLDGSSMHGMPSGQNMICLPKLEKESKPFVIGADVRMHGFGTGE